jgi:hypothetical protein
MKRPAFIAFCVARNEPMRGLKGLYSAVYNRTPINEDRLEVVCQYVEHVLSEPGIQNVFEDGWQKDGENSYWRSFQVMSASIVPRVPRLPVEDARIPFDAVRMATDAVMTHVGEAHRSAGDKRLAIEIARVVMNRTEDEYANSAVAVQRKAPWSFRYTITRSGDPIGVQQLIGLTKEAFFDVANGKKGELEIAEPDVLEHSKYVFITAQSPFLSVMKEMSTSRRERIEIHNIFFHGASIVQYERPRRPAFLSIGGNAQIEDRLTTLGFRKTGHKLKGTDKNIFVMQHRNDADEMKVQRNPSVQYALLRFMITLCCATRLQN